jgi:poly(3-hydroxybutyrate) depolymerase
LERDLPAVIVTPHYPAGTLWEEHITAVEAVLDDALAETHTDPNRVAITGVSAGGFAAWAQVIHSPQRYAALLSVSGSGYRTVQGVPAPLGEFCKVTEVPTRAIHGLADTLAEPRIIRAFVERVERCPDPGSVELIMWEGEGHLSTAARAYNDDQILGWLLDTIR